MIELLDHLPEVGDVVQDEAAVFEVLEADKTRAERIRITLLPGTEAEPEEKP